MVSHMAEEGQHGGGRKSMDPSAQIVAVNSSTLARILQGAEVSLDQVEPTCRSWTSTSLGLVWTTFARKCRWQRIPVSYSRVRGISDYSTLYIRIWLRHRWNKHDATHDQFPLLVRLLGRTLVYSTGIDSGMMCSSSAGGPPDSRGHDVLIQRQLCPTRSLSSAIDAVGQPGLGCLTILHVWPSRKIEDGRGLVCLIAENACGFRLQSMALQTVRFSLQCWCLLI